MDLRGAFLLAALALSLTIPSSAAAATPLVRVDDARLVGHGNRAVVTATVTWNREGIHRFGMIAGDLRLVAVSRRESRPTVLVASRSRTLESHPVQRVRFVLRSASQLAAIRRGNRVVLTASQHAYSPSPDLRTPRTYVTVRQLQAGAPRGRIGRYDCSDREIVAGKDLTGCDLVGASFRRARVSTAAGRTELFSADLTGADMREADLTSADLADARVNGADATSAIVDHVSLAHAEGTGFIGRTRITSSNMFDARMVEADFRGAAFTGTSLARSRFDHGRFAGATISGADIRVASLRSADMRGATLEGVSLYFADLTRAKLEGATITDPAGTLTWAILCRTQMPDTSVESRDCSNRTTPPAGPPFVAVDATLRRDGARASIEGSVRWNAEGISIHGMGTGELRAVAVDRRTGVPTPLAKSSRTLDAENPDERIALTIAGRRQLRAQRPGNRVVLTATQHQRRPDPPSSEAELTRRSYVTVHQLQAGPARGRVGSADCSDRPIGPEPGVRDLVFCDLAGAALADADLSGSDMHMADLTGGDLRAAGLAGVVLDGGHAGGVDASDSRFDDVSMVAASAPRLALRSTAIPNATFFAASLRGSSFTGSALTGTSFATAGLARSSFAGARLVEADLAYANLVGGDLSRVRGTKTSLFLSNLSRGTLRGASFGEDEEGRDPPRTAILCRTTMPDGDLSLRDCRR